MGRSVYEIYLGGCVQIMEKKALEAVRRFSLIPKEVTTVTVALSGGADSMALLNVLLSLREKLGITVKAAHLNHMIRGAEALRDENFVKAQCESLGVELACERADVPGYAAEKGISLELAAREIRYGFLERAAEGVIATAHTASDNLETVLFNLTRGTAADGLCGIPPKRGIFIRPLILCTRREVEDYCAEKGIAFVTDSTNLCDEYTRNKIRHGIVPLLKELNPSVETAASRMCESLREDTDYISAVASEYISDNSQNGVLDISALKGFPPAVVKRVIKQFARQSQSEKALESVHIEAVYARLGKSCKISIPGNRSVVIYGDKLTVKSNSAQNIKSFTVDITECKNTFFDENKKINSLLLNNLLDCDKIMGKSVVRTRLPGDSVRLLKRGCTKALTRLFSENRIPTEQRASIPVIADDLGIVWVYGYGVAQRCAVTAQTKRILRVNCKES